MKRYPKTAAIVSLAILTTLGVILTTRFRPPRVAALDIVETRQQIVNNTNRLRVANGLRPLDTAGKLNHGAQDHSDWMARTSSFTHSTDLVVQITQAYDGNWLYAGENIAVGSDLPQLLTALRQSPEHRANMLKPQYRRIGVGATWEDNRLWVTVWFEG